MFGNRTFLYHKALGSRSAVEQNYLVLIISVVIVPVKDCRRLLTCESHCPHGYRGSQINLTGGHDAAVIQLRKEYTRTYPKNCLHLVPAADRQRIQMILFDVFVNDNRYLSQSILVFLRNFAEVRIFHQAFFLSQNGSIRIGFVIYFVYEL